MDNITIKFRVLWLVAVFSVACLESPSAKQLTNKSAIFKTLRFKEGDIVDCYDINKQPTLDHHLLKNHKVQMKPYSLLKEMTSFSRRHKNIFRRPKRKVCPPGSVPIPRSQQDDDFLVNRLNASRSLLYPTNIAFIGHHFPGQQRAFVNMKKPSYPAYQGGGAFIPEFNPRVEPNQTSAAFIMLHNGPPKEMNLISTGWMASRLINGDPITRLYIFWTGDGYKTVCYNNINCKGFVQYDRFIYPTMPLYPPSNPGQIYGFEFRIVKQNKSDDWWLIMKGGDQRYVPVGYWPHEMFPYMRAGATMLAWGGLTIAGADGLSPPMGSSQYPRSDYNRDSSFLRLMYVDNQFNFQSPSITQTEFFGGSSGCYGVKNDGYVLNQLGYSFLYGGPGGDCGV